MLNITNIPAPRVEFIDSRTGLMSREWYRFFLNLFQLTGNGNNQVSLDDLQVGPPPAQIDEILNRVPGDFGTQPTQESALDQIAELQKLVEGIMTQTRSELGTMSELQQANLPWVTFDTTPENVPTDVGTVAWDGGTTLGVQMTTNVLGRVNESGYYYIKASSAITKGQVIMFTGSVGASGVPTGAPATSVTDGTYIMGVAAEDIANNGFGLVQFLGTLRGVDTSAFSDGDVLWYDPAVTGGLTKTKPSAPNVKVQIAAVISATNNGTILIRVNSGSVLGGTDSNVQFGTLADKNFIQYDLALQYWKNVAPGALTKTDDTNVTLTLGGTPGSALLAATSLTLGWTGQLSVARGGTGVSTAPANGQLLIGNGTGYTVANLTAGSNISISNTAGGISISSSNPGGTVTSVGLAMPSQFTVTNSPVTGSGTLTAAWNNQTANYIFAGPTTGAAAAPSFRALVTADIPSAALTKTDDTNVTLTLGGSPGSALLAATSLTLGWTGTLAVARGGIGTGTAGITAFNNITGYSASGATGTTSGNIVFSIGPTITGAMTVQQSGGSAQIHLQRTTNSVGGGWIGADVNYAFQTFTEAFVSAFRVQQGATNGMMEVTSTGATLQGVLAANGVKFPATQVQSSDVNTLDDYEEGTWSPGVYGDGGSAGSVAFTSAGYYTKIGRVVNIIGYVNFTNIGSWTGRLGISNLPFSCNIVASFGSATASNVTESNVFNLACEAGAISLTALHFPMSWTTNTGSDSIRFSQMSATSGFNFNLTYITTA